MDWNTEIEAYLSRHKDEIVENLCRFVQIPSVAAFGLDGYPYGPECARALDFCAELCREKGLIAANHAYRCVEARLSPEPRGRRLVIASHADVVPADDETIYPPFGGTVQGGYVVGRGAVDDKGPLIATLYALAFFKEKQIPLKNDVRLVFGSNEEGGMDDMRYYLEKTGQPDWGLAVTFPVEEAVPILEDAARELGFSLEITQRNPGYYVPETDPMAVLLTDLYNSETNSDDRPYVMSACTYARLFEHGCGFGGGNPHEVKPFPAGHGGAHGPDEAHSIPVLLRAVKLYILGIHAIDVLWG